MIRTALPWQAECKYKTWHINSSFLDTSGRHDGLRSPIFAVVGRWYWSSLGGHLEARIFQEFALLCTDVHVLVAEVGEDATGAQEPCGLADEIQVVLARGTVLQRVGVVENAVV